MKSKGRLKNPKTPEFVLRARRGFRLAAQDIKKRNKAFGLPLLVWGDKKAAKNKG